MKVLFEYKGHKIMFSHGLVTSELVVDGEVLDCCNGFYNNQFKNIDLSGCINESNETKTEFRVYVDVKLFHDDVTLHCDGICVETKRIAFL